jgi:hypothetical protein
MTYGDLAQRYASIWEGAPGAETQVVRFSAESSREDVLLRVTQVLSAIQQRRHELRRTTQLKLRIAAAAAGR